MMVKLTGDITHHGVGFVILERNGIGYKVNIPEDAAHGLHGTCTLFTHEVIRDDVRELFGFPSMDALQLFWKLISISGVGPKSAQKIVYASDVSNVKEKIMAGDVGFLTDVPGIGKKTAQKIILEMKGVLAEDAPSSSLDGDAVEALTSIGYPRKQAEDALSKVEGETTEARVRAALKMMGKR